MSGTTSQVPDAAGALGPRRRRSAWGRSAPYWLILPVAIAMVAVLAYPLYELIVISFERYGLFELIRHAGTWVGFKNYSSILHDPVFWNTLVRTIVFTVVNVFLTMIFGTLIALLLVRISTFMRIALTAGLMLVWAMPVVVAVQVWYWMTDALTARSVLY